MPSYYDLILGLIPLALFGVAGSLMVLGLQIAVAVPLAALVSVGLIGHALFVNGPVETVGSTTSRSSSPSSASASE